MLKKYLSIALFLALLAMLLPSCAPRSTEAQNQAGGSAQFRLLVSDEPNDIGDFSSLSVTISRIGVLSADTDNWTSVSLSSPVTVDLTRLIGDNASEVWNGSIASGNYTKVFIYVDNITGILKSETGAPGQKATVKLPSGKLQISRPFTAQADGTVSFVFDITVIKAGKSGKYILKPQIAESGASQHFVEVQAASSGNHEKETEPKGNTKK